MKKLIAATILAAALTGAAAGAAPVDRPWLVWLCGDSSVVVGDDGSIDVEVYYEADTAGSDIPFPGDPNGEGVRTWVTVFPHVRIDSTPTVDEARGTSEQPEKCEEPGTPND